MATSRQQAILDRILEKRWLSHRDFEQIAQLQSINMISFRAGSTFPPSSLRMLSNLRRLTWLHFHRCELSPENLADIGALPKITKLYLMKCTLSEHALQQLTPSDQISELSITGVPLGESLARHASRFSALTRLGLGGTAVTDADLVWFTRLPRLKTLTVHETAVTDAGILILATVPQVMGVYGKDSRITPVGYDAYFRAQMVYLRNRRKAYRVSHQDPATLADAQAAVLRFIDAYYQWHVGILPTIQPFSGIHQLDAVSRQHFYEVEAQINLERAAFIAAYCTDAYQHASRRWSSISFSLIVDPHTTELIDLLQVSKNRVCVYTKEGLGRDYYEYTLHNEAGHWKINDRRWWKDGKWVVWYIR